MPIQFEDEMYLNTKEACKHLSVSRETLNNYVNGGRIARHKRGIGRTSYYKQVDLDKLLEIRKEENS